MAKRKKAGLLDTNVLLRLLLDDVPLQTKAVERLLEAGGVFVIVDVVLIEMIFVLEKVYLFDRVAILENVRAVIRHAQFSCNRSLFEEALLVYEMQSKLSIVDCILPLYAREQEAVPVWTFDKDLVKHSKGSASLVV